MTRYYIFKDGSMIGSTGTKNAAIEMIRQYQESEDHYLLCSQYSYIEGEEIFVEYAKRK